jgi:hypothetical protein
VLDDVERHSREPEAIDDFVNFREMVWTPSRGWTARRDCPEDAHADDRLDAGSRVEHGQAVPELGRWLRPLTPRHHQLGAELVVG